MTTWTILIATLGQRSRRLSELLECLLPQTEAYDGAVNVVALYNNGERPLGEVRQDLLEHATSDYVSFVDDDDKVPAYFVDEVMTRLDGVVDYVGWQLQCYVDGVKYLPTYHSIRYKHWSNDRNGYYRDVSHLNPIKRTIALRGNFRKSEPPEDVNWVNQVRRHVKTEHYVDRVMYYYHSLTNDSTWRPDAQIRSCKVARMPIVHPYFSYHPASST